MPVAAAAAAVSGRRAEALQIGKNALAGPPQGLRAPNGLAPARYRLAEAFGRRRTGPPASTTLAERVPKAAAFKRRTAGTHYGVRVKGAGGRPPRLIPFTGLNQIPDNRSPLIPSACCTIWADGHLSSLISIKGPNHWATRVG